MKNTLITLQEILHRFQRYNTVGDWQWTEWDNEGIRGESLAVISSILSDPRHTLNIQIHEIIESLLCRQAGITQQQVDEWDMKYERARDVLKEALLERHAGLAWIKLECGCYVTETSDPGDDPHAPYHEQHNTASTCEVIIGAHLKINWIRYVREIEEL